MGSIPTSGIGNGMSKQPDSVFVRNWDGYDAEAISQRSAVLALRFLLSLPPGIPLPEATPHPDGDLGFDWYGRAGELFSISFSANGMLYYAGVAENGGNRFHGAERWTGSIPEAILSGIHMVCNK